MYDIIGMLGEFMKYTLSKGLTNSPDARLIRQSVFVEEQGFEYEFDDIDETALHLVFVR